ncbi:MAG: flagellar M-ring protein FliF [Ectothiorhodospiraceae bacterium]|nr:flagellar M-ring protein FliF [Ectothiorhodospiraceae bacterium]
MAESQALTPTQGSGLTAGSEETVSPRQRFFDEYFSNGNLRQVGLIVGLALAVAMALGLFFWAQQPSYRTVYSSLPEEERARVVEALRTADMDFRIDRDTGAIRVPSSQIHETRLFLAGQGLPRGQGIGYELLQEDQGFGTSQFMENARFQRALETELARSIMSLGAVENARVHLAVPRETVFIRETSQPSASVVLALQGNRSLNQQQVQAIVHLVSSSVPNLTEERVSVVDQRGNLLTRDPDSDSLGLSGRQFDYQQRVESTYVRRVEDLLTPIVGAGRVKAQVNTVIDFSHRESTEELFDPDSTVIRSEQVLEERRDRSDMAMGIPGALTNQPPGQGVIGGEDEDVFNAAAMPFNLTNSATRNYEVGKTIRHSRQAQGGIQRLTVAVLVDQPLVEGEGGEMVRQPMDQAELDRLTALVQDAVGFDANRGDNVNVISAAFQDVAVADDMPAVPFWEQPWTRDLGRWVVSALLGLALIFMVIRPLVNALVGKGPVRQDDTQPDRLGADDTTAEESRRLTGPDVASGSIEQYMEQANVPSAHKERLEAAKELVEQEPALAANVIKNWLSEDER